MFMQQTICKFVKPSISQHRTTSLLRSQWVRTLILATPLALWPSLASAQFVATGINLSGGTLTITGDAGSDTASVTLISGGATIEARRSTGPIGGFRMTYPAASVQRIVFRGNAGNDTFTNNTTLPVDADGGDGDDTLTGGGGADYLVGNYGNDTLTGGAGADVIFGSGGHDKIFGGSGNDKLKGHGGNDEIHGDSGSDLVYGGSGVDLLDGGTSADTIVSIGGDRDTLLGGSSDDFLWADSLDTLSDASPTEIGGAFVNVVTSFHGLSYDHGATSVTPALDLTNFDLPDPTPELNDVGVYTLVNYSDVPLFSAVGPTAEDVDQNEIGDCYTLGPISAVAAATPDSIRKLVVDLDDGTYVVRFFGEEPGTPAHYVRVDADLYTKPNGDLPYAGFGNPGSLWVPIVEKALAFFRNDTGSYEDISGEGGASWLFMADKEIKVFGTYTGEQIVEWMGLGQPAGATKNEVDTAVIALLRWIDARQAEGHPVYTNYRGSLSDSSAIILGTNSNWRRASHQVMVDRVLFDANGTPNGLIIRDQLYLGSSAYKTFHDFPRIYAFFGVAVKFRIP